MSKVILEGHIIVPAIDLNDVLSELNNHINLTRSEPGCIVFEVEQDQLDKCRFSVYEEFVNDEAFNNHQARVKSSKWGAVTINVERFYDLRHTST